jgi:hypothetical protein
VGGGPSLGVVGRGQGAQGAVGPEGVVLDPPVPTSTWASSRVLKASTASSSSRSRLLKLSTYGFCQGEPGSMWLVPVPLQRHQSRRALAVSSGPLSS